MRRCRAPRVIQRPGFAHLYVLGVFPVEMKESLALRVRQIRIHRAGRVDAELRCVHSAAMLHDQGECTVQVMLGLEPVKSDGPWRTAVTEHLVVSAIWVSLVLFARAPWPGAYVLCAAITAAAVGRRFATDDERALP